MNRTTAGDEGYRVDNQAAPVYGFTPISCVDAEQLSTQREVPHIIIFVVWPYSESPDQRPVLRHYYALNLPQAAVRAAEIEIRLREQDLRTALVAIRPATNAETNTFFRVMDKLEAAMPVIGASQVKEPGGLLRTLLCGVLGGKRLGERSERFDPNTFIEGSVSVVGARQGR
jgi:hypothetical protein